MKRELTHLAIGLTLLTCSFLFGRISVHCPNCIDKINIRTNEIKNKIKDIEHSIITLPINTTKRTRDSIRNAYNPR